MTPRHQRTHNTGTGSNNASMPPFDYAKKVAELDSIIADLQSDDIALDTALTLHDAGQKLVQELESYLKQAEIVVRTHTMNNQS
jgi:exodeoxyribonuclease VII small subunit